MMCTVKVSFALIFGMGRLSNLWLRSSCACWTGEETSSKLTKRQIKRFNLSDRSKRQVVGIELKQICAQVVLAVLTLAVQCLQEQVR